LWAKVPDYRLALPPLLSLNPANKIPRNELAVPKQELEETQKLSLRKRDRKDSAGARDQPFVSLWSTAPVVNAAITRL